MCHALSMLILYLEVSSKKNPNNFCAFDVMLSMCAFQVGRVELHAPLLLPRSFPQNITTLTTTIEGKPGAVPGFVVRGA